MAKDELFSGESKNIEYKVVVPDKSEKYMKTVVAFANTQGGRLVIGIDDKTHQVVGGVDAPGQCGGKSRRKHGVGKRSETGKSAIDDP